MRLLTKILVSLAVFISVIFAWVWVDYQAVLNTVVVNQKQIFEINKGDSVNKIIANLQAQQIEIKPYWFKVMAYRQKLATKLKAGEYELNPDLTMPQLLALFAEGKIKQYSITFPEGWTFRQMLEKIQQHPDLQQTLTGVNNESLMAKLNSDYKNPEGLFFPDTYFFERHSTDFALLKRAYDKMQKLLQNEWQQKTSDLPLQTPYQALILASIIEKETAVPAERTQIAGVFSRRLQRGMLLQTDPTVIYGMGDTYQGNIRSKDLHEATPYNTYIIKGLPPTPIALPGKDAIIAALHPANGDSLYFVARGDGSHIFSASLEAHNQAVNTFQKKRK